MNRLAEIAQIIKKRDNFLILGHENPDGDCIGSMLALKHGLDILGKDSWLVFLEEVEDDYKYFFAETGIDYYLPREFSDLQKENINIIALDSGDIERLGSGKNLIQNRYLLNIDHHTGNPQYGDINYVNPEQAAVGEILYDLLKLLAIEFDHFISEALAVAILADTGGLRYQNTSARLFRIMAELMENDADLYRVNNLLFGNQAYKTRKLQGQALTNLELSSEGRIAWLYVDQNMFAETGTDYKMASGLVNYARDIKGVEVGISFVEKATREVKCSLRSRFYVPVNKIAQIFGGGGHPRAAGCVIEDDLEQVMKKVIQEVEKFVACSGNC